MIGGLLVVSGAQALSLAREWALADRVKAASSSTGFVAWRRLARELGEASGTALREKWGGDGLPVLPLVDPWEYVEEGGVRGIVDGATVRLEAAPGGDLGLSEGLFRATDGIVYEVGCPSEKQMADWKTSSSSLLLQAKEQPNLALAAALPFVVACGGIAAGIASHHLQVEIFVI